MTPTVIQLHEEYKDKVVFLTVMLGYGEKAEKLCTDFIKEHDVKWPHLFDKDLKVFRAYNLRYTPTYVILDSKHRIVKVLVGGNKPINVLEDALNRVV